MLLEQYAAQDSRIKVFWKENGGVSKARNYALSKLSEFDYDWISFLDIDDLIGKERYNNIASQIGNAGEEVEYIRSYCHPTEIRSIAKVNYSQLNTELVSPSEYFNRGDVGGYTHSCFIKQSLFERYKIYFPEDMKILEDQVFSISYALRAKKIMYYTPRDYFYYTPDNCRKYPDRVADLVRCINALTDEFLICSSKEIREYYLNTWLPIKTDILLSELTNSSQTLALNSQIKRDLWSHCKQFKTKLKYLKLKLLRIL